MPPREVTREISGLAQSEPSIILCMTTSEFDLIAHLLRSKDPALAGARLVLLHQVPNADAARTVGATPQAVHRSAKRFQALYNEITRTFKKSLVSSASR
jgi:hypothetical protein